MQVMRWLPSRGAAVRELGIFTRPRCDEDPDNCWSEYRGGSVALLVQLPNLRSLHIQGGLNGSGLPTGRPWDFMVPERHLYIAQSLPQLEDLTLSIPSGGTWKEDTLEPLKHLTALTSLNLKINNLDQPLLVSTALSGLTCLQSLSLEDEEDFWATAQDHLMQTVSKLKGLTNLSLSGMVDNMPAELGELAQLAHLKLINFDRDGQPFNVPASLCLCTNLQLLHLGNLTPVSANGWRRICMSLFALPALDALVISQTDLSSVSPGQWALNSRLTHLELQGCDIHSVAPAICSLPLLQELIIDSPIIYGLPYGPYLRTLRVLKITCPRPGDEFQALKKAILLEELHLYSEEEPDDYGQLPPLWTFEHAHRLVPEDCEVRMFEEDGAERFDESESE